MPYRLLFILLLLTSCTSKGWVQTDLYFGLTKPGGAVVTPQEWESFRQNYISKVCKDGNTVIPATGSWFNKTSGRYITESTQVVIYLHKDSSAVSAEIDSLRKKYQKMFQQESVLRVDKAVTVSF